MRDLFCHHDRTMKKIKSRIPTLRSVSVLRLFCNLIPNHLVVSAVDVGSPVRFPWGQTARGDWRKNDENERRWPTELMKLETRLGMAWKNPRKPEDDRMVLPRCGTLRKAGHGWTQQIALAPRTDNV